ncbi:MAG: ATPase, T2SS/T4P/T4SS family [Planctomycetota bacterium]
MNVAEELLSRGLIDQQQLDEAVDHARSKRMRVDRALIDLGHVSEARWLELLSEHLAIPVVELESVEVETDVLRLLPSKLVYRKRLAPVGRENGTLRVVTSDAYDLYSLDEIRLLTGLEVEPVLALESEIDKFIKAHYGVGGDTVDEMVGDDVEVVSGGADTEDLLEMAQEASVIKLVNEIILEALSVRASDIHIEPYEHQLEIRYRIDGVLQPASVPPQIHRFQAAIISRLKILSSMNIAEKRLPQDGRIKFQAGGKPIDVRVSVIPMLFGEGVVMRILDKSSVLLTLQQLGMEEATYSRFRTLIERPHGIILVTGPTGSGKTTTLYASLNEIVSPELKVLTVEDPVEYNLERVNQIPVQHKIGMTFERGLRAILRHDPDVVMIGEIRDLETAEAAIQASLTGHLVLSTLHTNDSSSSATRLVDMGVEPFLVASSLAGAMAQRLVRRVCPDCREEYQPDPDDLPPDFPLDTFDGTLVRGAGCPSCRGVGFRGRSGIYELLTVNDEVAAGILERAPSTAIAKAGERAGMQSLRRDGWRKVLEKETTPNEVLRSTAL